MSLRYGRFDEAHTIILYDFETGWQGAELENAVAGVDRIIREVDYPVCQGEAFLRALINTFSRRYPRFHEHYILADSREDAAALVREPQREFPDKLNLH